MMQIVKWSSRFALMAMLWCAPIGNALGQPAQPAGCLELEYRAADPVQQLRTQPRELPPLTPLGPGRPCRIRLSGQPPQPLALRWVAGDQTQLGRGATQPFEAAEGGWVATIPAGFLEKPDAYSVVLVDPATGSWVGQPLVLQVGQPALPAPPTVSSASTPCGEWVYQEATGPECRRDGHQVIITLDEKGTLLCDRTVMPELRDTDTLIVRVVAPAEFVDEYKVYLQGDGERSAVYGSFTQAKQTLEKLASLVPMAAEVQPRKVFCGRTWTFADLPFNDRVRIIVRGPAVRDSRPVEINLVESYFVGFGISYGYRIGEQPRYRALGGKIFEQQTDLGPAGYVVLELSPPRYPASQESTPLVSRFALAVGVNPEQLGEDFLFGLAIELYRGLGLLVGFSLSQASTLGETINAEGELVTLVPGDAFTGDTGAIPLAKTWQLAPFLGLSLNFTALKWAAGLL